MLFLLSNGKFGPNSGKIGQISGNSAEPPALTGGLVTAGYQDFLAEDLRPEVWPDSWPEALPEKYPF